MSDAEKYAKIFRAAADGIAEGAVPRASYEAKYGGWKDDPDHGHMTYAWAVRYALTPSKHPMMSNDGDPYRLGMWDAFNGVATMFEKIVAEEQSRP